MRAFLRSACAGGAIAPSGLPRKLTGCPWLLSDYTERADAGREPAKATHHWDAICV